MTVKELLRKLASPADRLMIRAAKKVSLETERSLRDRRNVEIVLSASLRDARDIQDPVAYVEFLRGCIEHTTFSIRSLKESADSTPQFVRFSTLLQILQSGAPPIPFRQAQEIGLAADRLSNLAEPLENVGWKWAGDVGLAFRVASSFARKGRLLSTVLRLCRANRCLELGTAYGMSALFILNALEVNGGQGHLNTVEGWEPQFSIASGILQKQFGGKVSCHFGRTEKILQSLLPSLGGVDFLFHDAGHSREDYTRDFDSVLPALTQGSIVLFDDIRWDDPRFRTAPPETYRGWCEVVAHSRVKQAVEIDGTLGLILIE